MSARASELAGRAQRLAAARRRADIADRVATVAMSLAALLLAVVLTGVVGMLLVRGLPGISWTFLTTAGELIGDAPGIGPQIFVSLYMLALSLLITAPLGVGAAIYLAEYAPPGRVTDAIRFSAEALASVPSVVFGVFGSIVFVSAMGLRFSVLSGALTLALLNLPLMARVAEDAIRSVPEGYREGSLALGATRWQTIREVVLPSALPGIITAAVLTGGRIIGETAPLILTAGASISPNARYSLNPMAAGETLAVHIWVLKVVGVPGLENAQQVADATAAVLLLIVLAVNIGAAVLTERLRRSLSGAARASRRRAS